MSQADRDRLQYYSRKVKFFKFTSEKIIQVHPSTYLRIGQLCSPALFPSLRHLSYSLNPNEMPIFHIFLHIASPLLDSLELYEITYAENTIIGPFFASLSSPMLRHITLCEGYLSGDISIAHFKQLRSIELFDAVAARNFVLWEALGTLPTLEDLTVVDHSPLLLHVSENSNSQSGGPRYFEALESLCVTSSIHFIRHLLNFIDSPCLKSIKIDPVILSSDKLEPEDLFTPLTIVSSKWSQSLKNLAFRLDLTMKTQALDYDVMIRLWSWPLAKLRTLNLNKSLVSLGALRRIAENCPELRHLHIQFHFDLDTSIIPFADTSSKSLHHNLEDLTVDGSHTPSISRTQTMLECQIKVARYLDLIFPYLKSIELDDRDVFWKGIRDLVHLCRDASLSRQIAGNGHHDHV